MYKIVLILPLNNVGWFDLFQCTEHMFELLMQHHQPVSAVKITLHSSYGDHLDKGLAALSNLTEVILQFFVFIFKA